MKRILKWFFPASIKPTNEFKTDGMYAVRSAAIKLMEYHKSQAESIREAIIKPKKKK